MASATACTPWKIIALAIVPPTSNVAKLDGFEPIPSPIFGNTYVNTKISRSGCMIVRAEEHPLVLAEHSDVAAEQRAERVPRADARDVPSVCPVRLRSQSFAELPSGEVDEDRLERRFLHADIGDREALPFGVSDDLGERRAVRRHVRVHDSVDDRARSMPGIAARSVASAWRSPVALDPQLGVVADRRP